LLFLLPLAIPSLAQSDSSPVRIREADLRADASIYPTPKYPQVSVEANHAGRVVVEVVVAPNTNISPLARIQSTEVLETPDQAIAGAVLESLKEARYLPFFDNRGKVTRASGRVVWEFRLKSGKPEVVDPNVPVKRSSSSTDDDLKIAQRASQILASEATWNRADNRQCPPTSKTVSLYCALEKATLEVTGGFEHRGTVMEHARSAIDQIAPHHPDYNHLLMGYNNDPSTTFADIQRVLQFTEDRISKGLKEKLHAQQ
jgi:hypothetical protein